MKLLIDANLSPSWSNFLREAGHHAVHWTAIGRPDAPDEEIMQYAAEQGFVIVTRDLDFPAILAASRAPRPSVVLLRGPKQFPQFSGARVLIALSELVQELEAGAVVTLDVGKTRFKLLPLRRQ